MVMVHVSSSRGQSGHAGVGELWSLLPPVGLAFDDELLAGGGEPVDGGLGE
jgi:hypothetical protein